MKEDSVSPWKIIMLVKVGGGDWVPTECSHLLKKTGNSPSKVVLLWEVGSERGGSTDLNEFHIYPSGINSSRS